MANWILPQTRILQPSFPAEGAIAQYNLVAPALADGEGVLLQVDATGQLRVTLGAAIIQVQGPAPQDDPVTGNPVEISYESQGYTDTVAFGFPVSTDQDVVRPRASRYGVPYSMIVNEDGSSRLLYTADTAWADGYSGPVILGVRNDAVASVLTTVDGNMSPIAVDDRGVVFTRIFVPAGGVAPFYAEDTQHASGDVGVMLLSRRADTASSSAGSDGDYASLNTDDEGYLYERDKAYDVASQANRNYPVVDLASRRVTTPVLLASAMNVAVCSDWSGVVDVGAEVSTDGYTRITLWLSITPNDATHIQVRCLAKHTAAGADEYSLPILKADTSVSGSYVVYAEDELIDLTIGTGNAAKKIALTWVLDNAIPYVQFQIQATTDGGTDAVLNSAYVTYAWGQ